MSAILDIFKERGPANPEAWWRGYRELRRVVEMFVDAENTHDDSRGRPALRRGEADMLTSAALSALATTRNVSSSPDEITAVVGEHTRARVAEYLSRVSPERKSAGVQDLIDAWDVTGPVHEALDRLAEERVALVLPVKVFKARLRAHRRDWSVIASKNDPGLGSPDAIRQILSRGMPRIQLVAAGLGHDEAILPAVRGPLTTAIREQAGAALRAVVCDDGAPGPEALQSLEQVLRVGGHEPSVAAGSIRRWSEALLNLA